MIGRDIAHYHILEKLGEGGMGIVYKARDTHLGRLVALKVLPAHRMTDPERKRRFMTEAQAASAQNHPNIVTIHDIAQVEGVDFIVMELVEGKPLDGLIPRKGMPLKPALKYAVQIAGALAAAHAKGIIHRDLKPGNVMVTEGGLVKVLDFGLAKLAEADRVDGDATTRPFTPSTGEGTIVGTPAYMSPEQAECKPVDARSDIFSFGSVLYEMVTGSRAFHGDSNVSVLAAILREEPKPPSQVTEGVPWDLERIIVRCLKKDRERRFQHMGDVRIALEELQEESDSGQLAPAVVQAQRPRRRGLVWAAALVALVGLAAAGAGIWRARFTTNSPQLPKAVPLTTYRDASVGRPSFSPDGDRVAFTMCRRNDCAVYIKQIGVESPQLLVNDAVSPSWSPDGRNIAFRRTQPGGKVGYFLISPIGGRESKLVECDLGAGPGSGPYMDWMPDSKRLVLSLRGSPQEPWALFLFSLESRELTRLTSPKEHYGDGAPAVSPDGRSLVFNRDVATGLHLFRLALSGRQIPVGEPRRLDPDSHKTFDAAWTADGREIVYCSGPGRDFLKKIAAAGPGLPQTLAWAGEGVFEPAISRQGNRLAFGRTAWHQCLMRLDLPKSAQHSSPPTEVTATTREDYLPAYSPDGRRIVFVSNRSGEPELWVCDSDGRNPAKLTSLGDAATPQWSPDGEWIAFFAEPGGTRIPAVYRIRASGGTPQRLSPPTAAARNPSYSADGRWIYFSMNRHGGDNQIWKMPSGGGDPVQLSDVGRVARASPDGRFVYFLMVPSADSARLVQGQGAIHEVWRIPVEGGKAERILESIWLCDYAVVKEGIYFTQVPGADRRFFLKFYDLATRKIRTVAEFGSPPDWSISVSPDRRSILYSTFETVSQDLMLVENFR